MKSADAVRCQETSEATKLVVSISLLVGMIGLANLIWEPGESRPMTTFFAGRRLDLGVTTITYHQAITIATAVVVAIGLRFLLYRTRIGVSMRTNVDDRNLALLNGARPDRVGLFSWAIGASLAAVGGILIAPSLTLDPGSLSLLIVNAYAAAIFGRLRSLPLTFVGAIVLGLSEGYLAGYLPGENQYLAGLRPAAAVIVLFIVLLVMPNPRLRTRSQLREYFPAPSPTGMVMLAAGVVIGAAVLVTTLDTSSVLTYGQIFPLAIVALSLVPLVGYAGQISLAQLSFGGVGAVMAAHHGGGGTPLGLLLAVVVAAAVGGLVALPVRRLSGIYLALATAAFAVALDRWIFNLPDFDVGPVHISLFELGSTDIDPLRLFGYTFESPGSRLMLSAVAFALSSLVVAAVRWTSFGRQLVAMRDSEAACATLGLNLVWPRVAVFMMSAGIAGLGGAIYGMQLGTVSPERFNLVTGLPLFMLVVVGGAGLVGGALFAGISLFGVIPLTSSLGAVVAKINAVSPGLIGVGLGRNPSGVVPLIQEGAKPLRRDPLVLGAMAVAMVVVYAARQADAFGNWPFAAAVAAVFVVANTIAGRPPRPFTRSTGRPLRRRPRLGRRHHPVDRPPRSPPRRGVRGGRPAGHGPRPYDRHGSPGDDHLAGGADMASRIGRQRRPRRPAGGGRREPPIEVRPGGGDPWPPLRSSRSPCNSAATRCSTRRHSTPRPAGSPGSSGPTAPARPPCSTSSPVS